jgi:class 3 adenylate cyclase
MHIEALFDTIMDQTNQIMGCERSTVFLYDEKNDELWSYVATDILKNQIRIPANIGLSGFVFRSMNPICTNDAYNDSRFYTNIDEITGYKTNKIVSVPLINRKKQCIGTLQALNKTNGDFDAKDIELLTAVSHYVAIALENAKLYDDVNKYSEELKATLIRIETLEKIKKQLTKFVPQSVALSVQKDPNGLTHDKAPQEASVLFIDIKGFSKMTEEFDQRVINEMVECHFSKYLDCIERNRGEVIETSGDGLMVLFKEGPLESNAMDAVSAGLEIIKENQSLNDEIKYPCGRIDLHFGINSGEAWVGAMRMKSLIGERWFYTASGLVTILAARIGVLSKENRIYVGPATYESLKDKCQFEYIGKQRLKNIKQPVPVYLVEKILTKETQ